MAGATTFATMAYIIFVNPAILADAGMPHGAVTIATCLSAAFASILMGAFARYPIALAPGMGLNAYFAYSVVQGLGVPWQTALGAVFLSGAGFLALSIAGARERLLASIPPVLAASVGAGIGLFIAFIGFRNAGIIVAHSATTVTLGNLVFPQTLVSVCGLVLTAALWIRRVPAAILIGIVATAAGAVWAGTPQRPPLPESGLAATFLQLDIRGAISLGLAEIVFVFLFVDVFDNLGTLVAVGRKAGILDEENRIPRVGRVFLADSTATIAGSMLGTSTVVSYVESASGIVAGGRTGFTAIVVGALFAIAAVGAPFVPAIPTAATAPALILVGVAMMAPVSTIDWENPLVAVPAFLTLAGIPLTFSIANGLALGFTAYAVIHLLSGRARQVPMLVYVLAALFSLRFSYLSAG